MLAAVGALARRGHRLRPAPRMFNRAIVDTCRRSGSTCESTRTVLLFVTAATVLAALVAGLVPALRASRGDVLPLLNDEGRGTTSLKIGRLSRGLVIGEMALSFALLVVSGLVIRSIVNVTRFDPGIRHARRASPRGSPCPPPSIPTAPAAPASPTRCSNGCARLPGVAHAALSTDQPADRGRDDRGAAGPVVPRRARLPAREGHHGLGRVLRGDSAWRRARAASSPRATAPTRRTVAVVNEEFQRRYYPGRRARPAGAHVQRRQHRVAHHRRGGAGRPRHRSRRVDAAARLLAAVAAPELDGERPAADRRRSAGPDAARSGRRCRRWTATCRSTTSTRSRRRSTTTPGAGGSSARCSRCSASRRCSWPRSGSTA